MADRENLARAAEDDLLVRDETREPHRMDRNLTAHPRGRRVRRAGGSVELRVCVQLDDLRMRERPGRFGREPHHEHRSEREVRGHEACNPSIASLLIEIGKVVCRESRRSDHARDAGGESGDGVPLHRGGGSEVDRGVEPRGVNLLADLDAHDLVTGRTEGWDQDNADLALSSKEQNSHAARATTLGLIRCTAARKRFSLGPIPATESSSGA